MRRSVHGVEVEVGGALPASILEDVLGAFPEGDAGRPVDLALRLQPAAGPPLSEGRLLFSFGRIQLRAVAEAVALTDGRSAAWVADDGGRVELSVAYSSEEDRRAFTELIAPLALVLALRARGVFHVRAAALAWPDGRALLVGGAAGAGKTTLALGMLEHGGLDYLGDAGALLVRASGGVGVRALPFRFYVAEATARAFPRLAPLLAAERLGGRRPLDPRAAFPGRARAEATAPAVVLLPRVSPAAKTRLQGIAPADAAEALFAASALGAAGGLRGAREHRALLGETVAQARCLEVVLGADLLEAPAEVVRTVLAAIS